MSPSPDSVTIAVDVLMGAPSFVPGSLVTATVTLRADRPHSPVRNLLPSRSSSISQTASPAASSTTLSGFGRDQSARADYVVCEVSGRWSSDRAWVLPYAHDSLRGDALDNHLLDPVAEHCNLFKHRQQDMPWTAALADANSIGGGGRPGHSGVIFRSQTLVVCEREQIPVGSQVSFKVGCVLPDNLPPTLRGVAMRYTYALLVVADFPGCAVPQSVRVPFRVVSAGGTVYDAQRADGIIPVPTPRNVGPVRNRFLEEKETKALTMSATLLKSAPPDDIEIALALSLNGRLTPYKSDAEQRRLHEDLHDGALSFIREANFVSTPTSGSLKGFEEVEVDGMERSSSGRLKESQKKKNAIPVYGISQGKQSIARMYLSKRVHHLGDTISAIFHLNGDTPCYRLGARLEAQEVIQAEFAIGQKYGTSQDPSQSGVVFRTVYGEHAEFVMSNKNTHVTFSIPHDAPASFSTEVVAIRWLIHFVFLIPQTVDTDDETDGTETEDFSEIEPMLERLHISENGARLGDSVGWEGGTWSGEDPNNWTHLPQENVDVLRWTLPIVVSGQHGSPWGSRSTGKISFTRAAT